MYMCGASQGRVYTRPFLFNNQVMVPYNILGYLPGD